MEPDGVKKGKRAKLMEEVEFRGTVNNTCIDIDPNISKKRAQSPNCVDFEPLSISSATHGFHSMHFQNS
jgi:hypothetical protein